ncbi:MAG: hypothetical protein PHU25_19435 [Deltaproteobacteria bacterium]|nr:hypothetical protein [Deltaproteobacteria bacterium]
MDSIRDFEDMLELLERRKVQYLIIGGLAFIFHAKPRYTKDMDIWIGPDPANVRRANLTLAEFGSPLLLDAEQPGEILQLGFAPDRIDFFLRIEGAKFDTAWPRRVRARYGRVTANWIDLETLLKVKARLDGPRHREDARVLRLVRERTRKE